MEDCYRVWCPEQGEKECDALDVDAYDAEDAAEEWARQNDAFSAEYRIVGGQDTTVNVRGPDGALTTWVVSGEPEPVYTATLWAETVPS